MFKKILCASLLFISLRAAEQPSGISRVAAIKQFLAKTQQEAIAEVTESCFKKYQESMEKFYKHTAGTVQFYHITGNQRDPDYVPYTEAEVRKVTTENLQNIMSSMTTTALEHSQDLRELHQLISDDLKKLRQNRF